MNYELLKASQAEATIKSGKTRRGYAHVYFPGRASGADEHLYYDLRGLASHHQKFRNWCKKTFEARTFAVYFGGAA